ncbi:SRPBCC domain-containing protein [Nocardia mangyaensis]|uniref:SRPBCC domain-containing protein n=1 Tax=Nocardia mangyaensis TaxID=2213200 RepID=UPI0026776080|nr:SRPBCC domain-containing protein [Nocardia mangyaensis]MDO3646534.1 SRPBCC domain-containing protein [Nocardia mangyaensis]
MNNTVTRSISHAQFTIEREVPVAPSVAFGAFADPAVKSEWFGGEEGWELGEVSLDFRVGGLEVNEGTFEQKLTSRFVANYTDIIENERIVYTYDMWVNGTHISTSVATWEFEPVAAGTKLTLVEFGAHLDGFDTGAEREEGTRVLVDALAAYLESQA